ncbi:hypothetical protein ACT453_19195 [Bacillus sp. D-CC]
MIENWPKKPEGSQWTDDQWKAVVANGIGYLQVIHQTDKQI